MLFQLVTVEYFLDSYELSILVFTYIRLYNFRNVVILYLVVKHCVYASESELRYNQEAIPISPDP